MRPRCPLAQCDTDIQQAFNEFLVSLPVERLQALRRLRRQCKVFALSNTNPVMFNSWIDNAFRAEGLKMDDYFDGVIASFREHCCKPEKGISRCCRRATGSTRKRFCIWTTLRQMWKRRQAQGCRRSW